MTADRLADVRAEPVPAEGVVIHFADGNAVVRGGYRSVGSALDGPLGVLHCFSGRPSPGLQLEIALRGRPRMAAIALASGETLVVDGSSLWLAPLDWDPVPSLTALEAARTTAHLVEGPGLIEQRNSTGGEQKRWGPPPPPVRPPRQDRNADPAWLESIMGSALIRSGVGRGRISESEIRRILRVLDRHGAGEVPFPALAAAAGVAERRVPGYLAQLSQIVNIDGYEVIAVSSGSARFDRELLERQLQISR